MNDRRPLGTGPSLPDTELAPAPRAQLAAERIAAAAPAAADPSPARPAGRRTLGPGTAPNPEA